MITDLWVVSLPQLACSRISFIVDERKKQASAEKASERKTVLSLLFAHFSSSVSPPPWSLEQAIPQCTIGPSILGNCCVPLLKLQVLVIVGRNFQTTGAVLDDLAI